MTPRLTRGALSFVLGESRSTLRRLSFRKQTFAITHELAELAELLKLPDDVCLVSW